MHIDHIGIAVNDLDKALKTYLALGFKEKDRQVIAGFDVEVSMIPVGETKVELIRPTSPQSTIAKFLQNRGEGIHHVALAVPDIQKKLDELKAQGIRLIDETPKSGYGGRKVAFIHPESTNGVLLELVEE
ncbi:methylmalonyl-CoA epimerase [Candidatus Acetothermia bacterium]|nr:methylmalonyl-CoA epimerase [Candidatus Acetothermia bacterium]MBI3659922.1 methylmalonyl-CoA epimerase [Candidatus Acetothermia bacterium]